MALPLPSAHLLLPFSPVCLLLKKRLQTRNLKPGISKAARNFWSQHSHQEYGSPTFTHPSAIIIVFKKRVCGYKRAKYLQL